MIENQTPAIMVTVELGLKWCHSGGFHGFYGYDKAWFLSDITTQVGTGTILPWIQ